MNVSDAYQLTFDEKVPYCSHHTNEWIAVLFIRVQSVRDVLYLSIVGVLLI